MRIKEVRLENFKCFTSLETKFNKLTLITGANSSGKSSLIYGILGPIQSGEFPLNFSTNGKYVNMGDFEDISYGHNKSNRIKIGFTIEDDTELKIDTFWDLDKQTKLPKLFSLTASSVYFDLNINCVPSGGYKLIFNYISEKDTEGHKESYELTKKLNLLIQDSIIKDEKSKTSFKTRAHRLENQFLKNNKRIILKAESIEALTPQIEEKGSYILTLMFNKVRFLFNQMNGRINYISSFRFHPQKIRNEISKTDLRIGKYGDNYEDQILYWETKKNKNYSLLLDKLKKLNVLQDIKLSRISGGNYELKIKTHKGGIYSSLTDVGFGISQFLPIIVSDIQLGKNSTLFISQPEIHLHPSIQSDFGDYLLNEIHTNKKNYIIETHSEYLINKVRLLIVQKKLKPEEVSIYYFQKQGNVSKVHELNFEVDGQIKNAPKDFFDTYMTDVMNIALNS